MKKLFILSFLLFHLNLSFAGQQIHPLCLTINDFKILSPSISYENQRINFAVCLPFHINLEESLSSITVEENTINLLLQSQQNSGGGPPIDPPLPPQFDDQLFILNQGVDEGVYTVNLYLLLDDQAPPLSILLAQSQLNVLPAPEAIDSTSDLSVLLLILLLFGTATIILRE
ncbi:MAG: hypothetical protein JKY19_13705 [Alcanivoracaceae bacterium]|nr:hypothetical protein [Alcanivoracaceae bacterium]